MTRTITTYTLTTIMIITMMVPVSMAQAQTPAQTLTPQQGQALTTSLAELLSAVKGLQVALASVPTGQVLGVSIANNAPVIDGETYTVTGPGDLIMGSGSTDKLEINWPGTFKDGMGISSIQTNSALGQELELTDDRTAYVIHEFNGEAEFDGVVHPAGYWQLLQNRVSGTDTTPLSDTALATALVFGSVVVDVEIIEGTAGLDRFGPRNEDSYFIPRGGNDYVGGGSGFNTIIFEGAIEEYSITRQTGDVYFINGPDGDVRLVITSVEQLLFQNAAYPPLEAMDIIQNGFPVEEEEVEETLTESEAEETVEETEAATTEEQSEETVEPTPEVTEEPAVEEQIIETALEASLELPEQSATPDVAITTAISDTQAPTPGFKAGDTITLSDNVNVRDPFGLQGRIVGVQQANSIGTIIANVTNEADGYTWIPVDFQSGPDGWVASDFTDYDPSIEVDQDGFTILQLENPDSTIITFENIAEADLPTEDTQYDYPHGLHDFTLEVEPNSTETVTIYLEAEITTTDKEIRKYNPDTNTFETITDQVTFGTADLADTTVTTLTYDVIDNGPLDNDPRVGFIVDPVGVGEEVMMGMHTPDLSGLTDNDHNTHDAGTTLHEEHDVLFDLMPYADATHIAAQSGAWSDPATWQHNAIPGDDARVIIPEDITVTYGTVSDARLFTVRVDGNLHFSTTEDSQMIVDTLASGVKSEFYIGTESNPVPENVTVDIIIANNGDIDTTWDTELISRGVILHGDTKLHGHEKTTHGKVSVDPMAGDTSITMKEAPDEWGVGDRVVVAGSRHVGWKWDGAVGAEVYQGSEDEVVTITSISGRTVGFDAALQYDHDTPRSDLKVSVANYTRNITIATEDPDTALIHERGHFMQMHSDDVDIRYVAFHELGRTNKSLTALNVIEFSPINSGSNVKGRYPMHFHRTGVTDIENPAIAIGNSVFGSPGWGYVHHDSNAIFHDNASFDTLGAGYVAETGNEIGSWTDNIAIKARGRYPATTKSASDGVNFDTAIGGAGFYFQGRMVESFDNIAASVNQGYIFWHRGWSADAVGVVTYDENGNRIVTRTNIWLVKDGDETVELDGNISFSKELFDFPDALGARSQKVGVNQVAILHFEGNEAFATRIGFGVTKGNPHQPNDIHSHIKDFTFWNVGGGIELEYTGHYIFEDFEIIGQSGYRSTGGGYTGIGVGNNSHDIAFIDGTVDNFEYGARFGVDDARPREGRNYNVVNIGFSNIVAENVSAFAGNDPSIIEKSVRVFDLDDIPNYQFEVVLDQPLVYAPNTGIRKVLIDGVKTDTFGPVDLVTETTFGHFERFDADLHEVIEVMKTDGYFTATDGKRYFVLPDYYSDRATGEIHKFGYLVELDDSIDIRVEYQGEAIDKGIIDFSNEAPIANNDTATTDSETDVVINLLANDNDPDDDSLEVNGITQPRHGKVFDNGNGRVTYRPDFDFTGQDFFKYWVTDNHGNFTPAYVSIGVDERAEELPEPEAPEINTTPPPVDPDPVDPETPSEDSVEPTPTPGTGATTLTRTPNQDLDLNGTLDRLEAHIASLVNKEQSGQKYNTLRLKNLLAKIRNFYNRTEAELGDDTGYQYPLGLFEFEAEVDPGSTETITIYLDQVYDTTDWVYRKYNGTTYIDISDQVTYSTADVDGTSVTTITYDVTDNGPLDTDDRLGFIKDPAGPGVPSISSY